MLTFKNKLFVSFENLSVKKNSLFIKNIVYEKNDNKKKSQVIQHLLRISEVNHVYDDLSRPNPFYGGFITSKSQIRGEETKIKVENEEHVTVMEDDIGKKPIKKEIDALVLLM